MAKRGRPKKEVLPIEEQEDIVIEKYMQHVPMSLEETALALWMNGGRVGKPMTKMGILKIEQNALLKLKKKLIEAGLSANDVLGLLHEREKRTTDEYVQM